MEEYINIVGVTVTAAIAIATILYSNRNNKQQIVTNKLEELYEKVKLVSIQYQTYLSLQADLFYIQENRKPLSDYYALKDHKFSIADKDKMLEYLIRIEVLAHCYTSDSLREKILAYEDMMYTFTELISVGASLRKQIKYKQGFPDYDEQYIQVKEITCMLAKEIDLKA